MINNAPFFKVSIPLILGILYAWYALNTLLPIYHISLFLWVSMVIFYHFGKRIIGYFLWVTLIMYLFIFTIGIGITQPYKFIEPIDQKTSHVSVLITSDLKKNIKSNSFFGEITSNTYQKIYFQTQKDCLSLCKNDIIVIPVSELKKIYPTNNPEAFDFNKNLISKGIIYKAYLKNYKVIHIAQKEKISTFRYRIDSLINQHFTVTTKGIAYSLLLGDKSEMTPELDNIFKKSGNMHMLALSGMHIGIIIFLLNILMSWKRFLGKKSHRFLLILQILIIWIYAFIVGNSPSILRAASMFTLLTISYLLRKKSNPLNTIGFTCFCLLIYNPLFVFSIGFQLSFFAVISITLFPYWEDILQLSVFPRVFISLITISVLAQLGTLPVVAYHFHFIPIYSLFSGLLSGFLISILMYSGIAIILISFLFPVVVPYIHFLFLATFKGLLAWLNIFSQLPQLPHIHLSPLAAISLYFSIFSLLYSIYYQKKNLNSVSFICFFCCIFLQISHQFQIRKKSITIYQSSTPIISLSENNTITTFTTDTTQFNSTTIIQPHQSLYENRKTTFLTPNQGIYTYFGKKHILWVNQFISDETLTDSTDILLYSAKQKPNKLLKTDCLILPNKKYLDLIENKITFNKIHILDNQGAYQSISE
ncbi:ComEC/Rec2 family competence protein [Flammeovirga kamogawensis]|uniref:ComEC family competence protein n=1 Tax=Flammeovirga kamogawensis TaxID=373891 RepID=A0ABX8GRZ2_9BACT|nr:ComEC/Rec2 family competence protein [Flammeovirga kamogawensis]MBB6461451.1 ComEC/Rec2-related protein [Flammeovirga kamogawensis]QWG06345.1 ComEC family competence protein [Flammeovirga kamogawensis]TRX68173.1 ComEC family competence protein [Flammeovirga kamogawensis]